MGGGEVSAPSSGNCSSEGDVREGEGFEGECKRSVGFQACSLRCYRGDEAGSESDASCFEATCHGCRLVTKMGVSAV